MAGKKGKDKKKDKGKKQSGDLKRILASVKALSGRLKKLEQALNAVISDAGPTGSRAAVKKRATGKKPVVRKAVAKKAPARKPVRKKAPARKKAPVKKAVTRKKVVKRRVAVKKAATKKTRARRT